MSNDLGYSPLINREFKGPVTVGWANQIQDNITAINSYLHHVRADLSLAPNTAIGCNSIIISTGAVWINSKFRVNTGTLATCNWANIQTGGAETTSTAYYVWAIATGNTSLFDVRFNNTAGSYTGEEGNSKLIGQFWNDSSGNISMVSRAGDSTPRRARGYFDGNNAATQSIFIGWQPTWIEVVQNNTHGGIWLKWFYHTGVVSFFNSTAIAPDNTGILSFDANGFTIGSGQQGSLNKTGERYFFHCEKGF